MSKKVEKSKNYTGPVHGYNAFKDGKAFRAEVIPGQNHGRAWKEVMDFVRD